MDYELYMDFLEQERSPEVGGRDMEVFAEESDIDILAEVNLSLDGEKYRLTIKEDASPNSGNANYGVKLSEKKRLSIDDGYTNWRKTFKEEYNQLKALGFKSCLKQNLNEEVPLDLDIQQTQL
ncbi:MAG: hypothetical protein J07AB43_12480 [Candidatus Nanosalina sp. J07AB43]|jgi:hypothetical protein|nr:MAG: hypothetical protein J07AB43_12480 [Candidatus Nanosalina sp. J07AB43]